MNTIRVKRANVILDVSPDDKDFYMAQGYSVINADTGEIIEKAIPNDVPTLKMELENANKTIKKLEAENKKLKAEIKKLKD